MQNQENNFKLADLFNRTIVSSEKAEHIRQYLTQNTYFWAQALAQITKTFYSDKVEDSQINDVAFQSEMDATKQNCELIANAHGQPFQKRLITTAWPTNSYIHIKILNNSEPTKISIQYNDKIYKETSCTILHKTDATYIKDINWPKDLNMRGDLKIIQEANDLQLSVPVAYPIKVLVDHLRNSEELYDLLVEQELINSFFFADSDAEALAIVGLVLYNYVK